MCIFCICRNTPSYGLGKLVCIYKIINLTITTKTKNDPNCCNVTDYEIKKRDISLNPYNHKNVKTIIYIVALMYITRFSQSTRPLLSVQIPNVYH